MEREFFTENITLTLSVRDLCIIGKTLSDRYTGSAINIFVNPINKAIQAATALSENVPVTIPGATLFEIIEILGKESEFLYNDFNKSVEAKLTAQLTALAATDLQLVQYINDRLTKRKDRIWAYQNGLVKWYVKSQGLNIDITSLEPPQPPANE